MIHIYVYMATHSSILARVIPWTEETLQFAWVYWSVFFFKKNLFIYFWLCWVFFALLRVSLVAASRR